MSEVRLMKYLKFKNRFLNLIVERIDLLGNQHGLFYEDGGFIYNSYDCSLIHRGAEGEIITYNGEKWFT